MENGELLLNGHRISLWDDEKVLEVVAPDCECTYCHPVVHLKIVEMVKFMLCMFSNNKNRNKGTHFMGMCVQNTTSKNKHMIKKIWRSLREITEILGPA